MGTDDAEGRYASPFLKFEYASHFDPSYQTRNFEILEIKYVQLSAVVVYFLFIIITIFVLVILNICVGHSFLLILRYQRQINEVIGQRYKPFLIF